MLYCNTEAINSIAQIFDFVCRFIEYFLFFRKGTGMESVLKREGVLWDSVLCPAKINLFLEITSRRENGYHEIDSVMQKVALCDRLEMAFSEGEGIEITSNDKTLPTGEKNLVYKAVEGYFARAGFRKKTEIYIDKRIPVSAGLAGGSTDAAGALKILERQFHALKRNALAELALSLGADVPFCLFRAQAICQGLGEELSHCKGMPDCYLVIAKHRRESVSTKDAYQKIDSQNFTPLSSRDMADALARGSLADVINASFNRFEELVLPTKPIASEIRRRLLECGASHAMMSGSGPSVFGIFESETAAKAAKEALKSLGCFVFVTHPWR